MPQSDLAPLAQLMNERFDELVDRLTQKIPEISDYYASLSPEHRRVAAANLYRVLRASVESGKISAFAQAIEKIARDRIAQGGSAEDLRLATGYVNQINLSLVADLAHSDPDAAVQAFTWLDQLSQTSLQVFMGLAQEALARHAEELDISIALSERLEQAQRLSDVAEAVFEQLSRLGVDRAIMSMRADDPALQAVAGARDRDENAPRPQIGARFSPDPLLDQAGPDEVYLLAQMADAELPDDLCELLAPSGVVALASFPLRDEQALHGLLILGYREKRLFSDEDRRFLALLARMLRNRVANLLLIERLREQIERAGTFQSLVENANDSIIISSLDGVITYANQAAAQLLEVDAPSALVGRLFRDFVRGDDYALMREQLAPRLNAGQSWKGAYTVVTSKNGAIPVESSAIPLLNDAGAALSVGGVLRDERERLALIESLRQSNAEQQHTLELLRQVSTPLIPIIEGVLIMPIVGEIDERRAGQIMETLLQGVARTAASTVLLDITGVPLVDTSVANALVLAARAVRLLGAEAILVGITPEVAQTLVGLGADLRELATRGDLQSGITYALRQHGYQLQRNSAPQPGVRTSA